MPTPLPTPCQMEGPFRPPIVAAAYMSHQPNSVSIGIERPIKVNKSIKQCGVLWAEAAPECGWRLAFLIAVNWSVVDGEMRVSSIARRDQAVRASRFDRAPVLPVSTVPPLDRGSSGRDLLTLRGSPAFRTGVPGCSY